MFDLLFNSAGKKNRPEEDIKEDSRADKPFKSLLKTISWRIVGTADTMILSYIMTGKISVAVSIGTLEVFTKTVLYYFHERIWSNIHRIKFNLPAKSNRKQYELNNIKQRA